MTNAIGKSISELRKQKGVTQEEPVLTFCNELIVKPKTHYYTSESGSRNKPYLGNCIAE